MVSPRDTMEIIETAVEESGKLPSEMSFLLQEADAQSDDADVSLPLLEVTPVNIEDVVVSNTDLVGYVTDDDGNRTGRIYYSEYEMTIQFDIWTTKHDGHDPDDLGEELRNALYPYSSYGPQQQFVDEDNNPIDQITYFRMSSGERVDDLVQTPTVRRWSQEVEVWGCEEFRTDEDYIASVSYPSDGDLSSDEGSDTVDNT